MIEPCGEFLLLNFHVLFLVEIRWPVRVSNDTGQYVCLRYEGDSDCVPVVYNLIWHSSLTLGEIANLRAEGCLACFGYPSVVSGELELCSLLLGFRASRRNVRFIIICCKSYLMSIQDPWYPTEGGWWVLIYIVSWHRWDYRSICDNVCGFCQGLFLKCRLPSMP